MIDFVGSENSSTLAVNLVRRAGTVVIVGLFGGEFKMPLPMFAPEVDFNHRLLRGRAQRVA